MASRPNGMVLPFGGAGDLKGSESKAPPTVQAAGSSIKLRP